MTAVLITGGRGMVGRAIQRVAAQKQVPWTILAPSRQALNLMDRAAVAAYLEAHSVDFIIHCAAKVGGIKANMADPTGFYVENIIMNTNLIEEARAHDVPKFAFLGSSCMYPRDLGKLLCESDILTAPLEPTNEGYALAKICGAKHCQYISDQFGLSYKTLIPCNLYGEGDHFDPVNSHLIAAILLKMHAAQQKGDHEVEIWGTGEARREFLYVDDLARFVIEAYDRFDALPAYLNVGLGHDYTVNEYYEMAAKIVGYTGRFTHNIEAPVGMMRKLMDSSRAKAWGWNPATSLEEGLRQSYDYYLSTLEN